MAFSTEEAGAARTDEAQGTVGAAAMPAGGEIHTTGSGRLTLSAFLSSRQAQVGIALVVSIVLFCFVGPLVYHTNQGTSGLDLFKENLPPGAGHPLGTNEYGYDILGRLMVGGQSSLELGFAVALATSVIGTLYGALAGLAPRWIDAIMMRVLDTLLAVPSLVLLLILVNIFTPNLLMIITLLTLLSWLVVARLVRGEVLSLRVRDYVYASRMMGGRTWRIMNRHMLPNAIGVVIVNATFTVSDSIYTLSALSFLGLGLPPPASDWGTMLSDGITYLYDGYWWMVYPPAIILILTVIGFNLIGDALRDALDVRLQRR
jgi:peptide/nickel transport system permease protein